MAINARVRLKHQFYDRENIRGHIVEFFRGLIVVLSDHGRKVTVSPFELEVIEG